jgi:hypothetical protein
MFFLVIPLQSVPVTPMLSIFPNTKSLGLLQICPDLTEAILKTMMLPSSLVKFSYPMSMLLARNEKAYLKSAGSWPVVSNIKRNGNICRVEDAPATHISYLSGNGTLLLFSCSLALS